MIKHLPGTKVRYRDYREPETASMDRTGVVEKWGNKWVEIKSDLTGKTEWASVTGLEVTTTLFQELSDAIMNFPRPSPTPQPPVNLPPVKLPAGTKVRYRDYRASETDPMELTGTVEKWGNKWVEIRSDRTGKIEWSTLTGAVAADAPIIQEEATIQVATRISPFAALTPGTLVGYRFGHWDQKMHGGLGGWAAESGLFWGRFRKYDKHLGTVWVDPIPAHGRKQSEYQPAVCDERLCELVEQRPKGSEYPEGAVSHMVPCADPTCQFTQCIEQRSFRHSVGIAKVGPMEAR